MNRGCVGHVQGLRKHFDAVFCVIASRRRLQCLRITGTHCYSASLGGEGFGSSASNPLTGRGHDRNAVLQTCIHSVEIIKVRVSYTLKGEKNPGLTGGQVGGTTLLARSENKLQRQL